MKLWKKARMLWKRRQFEADLAEEMRLHREMSGARAFGSEVQALEESRAVWGFGGLDSAMQDLHYAIRGFRKAPGFTLAVIGTIGMALGLNTAMFSVFNSYVLRPLAVRAPHSLYSFYWQTEGGAGHRFTWQEYQSLAKQQAVLSSVVAYRSELIALNGQAAFGQMVSENYFADLGPGIDLGRALAADDRNAIVLSRETWEQRFGADPLVIGRKVAAVGAGIGVAGALVVAPLFANQLSAVNPFEPMAYGAAIALVVAAAELACWHPSRSAAGVDPVSTLRCD